MIADVKLDGMKAWRAREIGIPVPESVPAEAVLRKHSVSARLVGYGADRYEYTAHHRWEWTMTCDGPDIIEREVP